MKYILDFQPDVLIISMEGNFTFQDARHFRNILSVMIDEKDCYEVRLDIRKLDMIDATAVNLMMSAHDLAKKLHMSLVFAHPQGQVYNALCEAGKYNAINIQTSV